MHIRYSSGFKLVSSWMNKYDLIRFVHICINIYLSHNRDVGLIYCLFESAFMHLLRNFFFSFFNHIFCFLVMAATAKLEKRLTLRIRIKKRLLEKIKISLKVRIKK